MGDCVLCDCVCIPSSSRRDGKTKISVSFGRDTSRFCGERESVCVDEKRRETRMFWIGEASERKGKPEGMEMTGLRAGESACSKEYEGWRRCMDSRV